MLTTKTRIKYYSTKFQQKQQQRQQKQNIRMQRVDDDANSNDDKNNVTIQSVKCYNTMCWRRWQLVS